MITIKQWLETFNYRITEGDIYGWLCYGQNAQCLSAWNGENDSGGWSGNIIFDTTTQTVYEVTVCDYTNNRAYRIINPDFKKAYNAESISKGVSANEAWDDVNYVDLEVDDDWLTKSQAIVAGQSYDTRVSIPIELPDNELLVLFKMAHDRNMTFNDFVQEVLVQALADYECDPALAKKHVEEFKGSIPHGY